MVVGHTDIYYAEISGSYGRHVALLVNKLGAVVGEKKVLHEDLVAISCLGGAVHGLTGKKMLNITQYSSGIMSKAAVEMGVSPVSTSAILTWKQVMEEEKMTKMNPAVKSLYKWLNKI